MTLLPLFFSFFVASSKVFAGRTAREGIGMAEHILPLGILIFAVVEKQEQIFRRRIEIVTTTLKSFAS